MKLSVIIVSYNVKYFLEQCLLAVIQATRPLKAEIIVVDNHSVDGTLDYLLPGFPDVIFLKSDNNLGFGRANNLALQSARGDYILFLNPDTIIPEDCLVKAIGFLEEQPMAGALGIRMLDGCGQFLPESKRSFPTTAAAFYKLMGFSGLFPGSKRFNKYSLGYLDEHKNHLVEVLSGAFMMVKNNVLKKTGGFDEQFFMYGEDIDLSYRIRQAGYHNWYFSKGSIIHFKGESTRKESFKYLTMFYEAMIVFVNKHYKGKGAWITRSVLKTGIGLRGVAGWMAGTASSQNKKNGTFNKIILGTIEEYNECCRILCTSNNNAGIKPIHYDCDEQGIHEVLRLKQNPSYFNAEIIFCAGKLPYSIIIHLVEKLGTGFSYRFHAAGSNSIVGSDSKQAVGETIASH